MDFDSFQLSGVTDDSRRSLSADRPYHVVDEQEPTAAGQSVAAKTVFLTVSECPIGCHMCDLWKNTLRSPTPAGAVPRQIDWALGAGPKADWIKLYNSGNFFDARSIPPSDYAAIAERCQPFSRVVVENHPSFGRGRVSQFRDLLRGRLEVAVGLETVQPRWLSRLGKRMDRDQFDRYARWLHRQSIDLRVFLIVGVPGIGVSEAIRWTRLSVRHAVSLGARHVSLIPARSGHGWNGQASHLPALKIETLAELQSTAIDDAAGQAVVTVDLWDLEQACDDSDAGRRRLKLLRQINQTQSVASI